MFIQELISRYPKLSQCEESVRSGFGILLACFRAGGKVLVCGNGGSAADADHIVGELLNKFKKKRRIAPDVAARIPKEVADKLVGALPAISLVAMSATLSSISNDSEWDVAFAQQVCGLGRRGDVLIAISTSGNSRNVLSATVVARALGIKVIGLTGESGGELAKVADVAIRVPETETYKIQELHLPVYHCLCLMLENRFFGA